MSGNIVENCLEEVKSKDSLLIITIASEREYQNLFTSTDVSAKMREMNGVLLEMSPVGKDYENFRQVYEVGTPPLICIISANGIVLDVVRGEISQERLLKVLNFSFENLNRGYRDQGFYPFRELLTQSIPDIKSVVGETVLSKPHKKSDLVTPADLTQPIPDIRSVGETVLSKPHKKSDLVTPTGLTDDVLIRPIECKTVPNNPTANFYRLKFNISNGSQVSESFGPGTTLEELKRFLQTQVSNAKRLVIIRPHPREEFSCSQDKLTLDQLAIQSGSSLIVRVERDEIKNLFNIWGFFTFFYSILISIYAYFFPRRNYISKPTSQNRVPPNPTPATKPLNSPEKARMVATHAKTNSSTRVVNRRDNMHRLSDLDNKDGDNSTYNGNSTQQQ